MTTATAAGSARPNLSSATDYELVQLYVNEATDDATRRDIQAHIYVTCSPALLRLAAQKAAPKDDPEDLVQQTFFRVFCGKRHRRGSIVDWNFPTDGKMRVFLARQLLSEASRGWKNVKAKPPAQQLPDDYDPAADEPDEPLSEEQERQLEQVYSSIPELPTPVKQQMALLITNGLKAREIAQRLGVTVNVVTSFKRRWIEMLRGTIHPELTMPSLEASVLAVTAESAVLGSDVPPQFNLLDAMLEVAESAWAALFGSAKKPAPAEPPESPRTDFGPTKPPSPAETLEILLRTDETEWSARTNS